MRRESVDEGRRWLEQAREDLRWAKDLAQRGGFYIACFLAQQVGEKALKAFLYAQGEEIVIGHSIGRLCEWASKFEPQFSLLAKKWVILDSYYIPTRYPNSLPDSIPAKIYTEDVAKQATLLAEEIVDFVRGKIF